MQNRWQKIGVVSAFCLLTTACTHLSYYSETQRTTIHREFRAMLYDPITQKDFRAIKNIAQSATLYKKDNKPAIAEADVRKLDIASQTLIHHFHNSYHANIHRYQLQIFIGKNQYQSCYSYYTFGGKGITPSDCYHYIKGLRGRSNSVFHANWRTDRVTSELVSTFALRNGENVYLGLEISEA